MRIADLRLRIADCAPPVPDRENAVDAESMKLRTKRFALRVIRLVEAVRKMHKANLTADTIGRQLLRSAISVGANYRAACRARSSADFVSKMGIVEEQADETKYWIELLVESMLVGEVEVSDLLDEADQLVAISVASIKTSRKKR